jgi:hypothetical protein
MDLLAPILAYLGTVTAIVVAVAMSYDVFIYTPLHSINPQHTLTFAAKSSAAKAALAASAAKIAAPSVSRASVSAEVATANVTPQIDVVAKRRAEFLRREAARRKHTRWLARQARAREWASRQPPEALGYADEPSAEGLYNAFPYQ